jgi:hypothetical protein
VNDGPWSKGGAAPLGFVAMQGGSSSINDRISPSAFGTVRIAICRNFLADRLCD